MEVNRFGYLKGSLRKMLGIASLHLNLLLFLFSLSSFVAAQVTEQKGEGDHWTLKKEEEGIKVFIRHYKDSKLLEFKAVTELPFGLSTLISVICDIEDAKDLFAASKKAELLKKVNEMEWVIWSFIDAPFPCDDRDMVVRMTLTQDSESGVINIDIASEPGFIPEKKSKVRIPLVDGSITYIPIDKNKTRIVYQNVTDPGGLIPSWLINMGVIKAPFETLQNYRRLSAKEKHQDVHFDFIKDQ